MRNLFLLHILFFILMSGQFLPAQFSQRNHFDLGRNQASRGDFIRVASLSSYQKKWLKVTAGFQGTLLGPVKNPSVGVALGVKAEKKWKRTALNAEIFHRRVPFSLSLNEINTGFLGGWDLGRFSLCLGNNFRRYILRKDRRDEGEGFIIRENRNLMYRLCMKLRPASSAWNLSLALCNYDYFIIEQELNPLVTLRVEGKVQKGLVWFSDLWYQTAGFWNEQVNVFGVMFRMGFVWEI